MAAAYHRAARRSGPERVDRAAGPRRPVRPHLGAPDRACYRFCMSATTVKLEAALLKAIRSVKPPSQSLSAYVREAVERDVTRRKMRDAAERYRALLEEHPGEAADVALWEGAPLATPPRKARK